MKITYPKINKLRLIALLLTVLLNVPLLSSCSTPRSSSLPPIDDTRGGTQTAPAPQQQAKSGLSNKQKVVLLAGAAALYYLYNQHKNKQEQGAEGKYYLSKNGRIYYRDAQHRAHWVTPPPGGIKVPEQQAARYRDFQGYDNRPTGRDLTGLPADPVPSQYPVPAQ